MNLLFALLIAGGALAGDHRLGAEAGAVWLSRTDLMLSPNNLSGALPHVGIRYEGRTDRWKHAASLAVSTGSYRSQPDFAYTRDGEDRSTEASVATIAHFQYALGRRVAAGDWTLHLGATSANEAANYVFVAGFTGVEHYLGAFELGPWLDVRRDLGDASHLQLQAWAPIGAWMGRNPYPVHNAEHIWSTRSTNVLLTILRHIGDGSPRTLNQLQAAHLRAGWTTDLSRRWALAGAARLDWLHYSEPHPLVELQLGADLALQGRF